MGVYDGAIVEGEGIAAMQYRKLGRTNIEVSTVALGCWAFGGGPLWGNQDEDDAVSAVHTALDVGITFFDTAELYGDGVSETILGRALQGRRDRAVIATKASKQHLSKQDIVVACERSLKRLDTDYIDLYQAHWPNPEVPVAETLEAMDRLKQEGKIRAVGVSNFGPRDMADLVDAGQVETNQLLYSLLTRMIEHEVMPICEANNIGILCYSPLAQGLLTGKWRSIEEVPEARRRSRLYAGTRPATMHDEPGCEAEVVEAVQGVRDIAAQLGRPMAAVALAWCLQRPAVASVLAGARNAAQVEQNARAGDLVLPDEAMAKLDLCTDKVKARMGANLDILYSHDRSRFR